jgi:soluble lytic murein transglycosylase
LVSPKAGTEDAAASIQMQTKIRDIIDTEQSATGKELTRDRKRQIMEQVVMDQAFVSEWGRDPQKPTALLTPEELQEAYVKVGGDEVRLTSIPAEQRRQITQTLNRRGLPVTEQAIAELWVKAGRPR